MPDHYAKEAARIRARVQGQLQAGTEPTLTPYEQFLLCGFYERELDRLERQNARMGETVDTNYAARLDAERVNYAAVNALAEALPGSKLWDDPTATPLDNQG